MMYVSTRMLYARMASRAEQSKVAPKHQKTRMDMMAVMTRGIEASDYSTPERKGDAYLAPFFTLPMELRKALCPFNCSQHQLILSAFLRRDAAARTLPHISTLIALGLVLTSAQYSRELRETTPNLH